MSSGAPSLGRNANSGAEEDLVDVKGLNWTPHTPSSAFEWSSVFGLQKSF